MEGVGNGPFLSYFTGFRCDANFGLCRCNNVLWISGAKGVEMQDVTMED